MLDTLAIEVNYEVVCNDTGSATYGLEDDLRKYMSEVNLSSISSVFVKIPNTVELNEENCTVYYRFDSKSYTVKLIVINKERIHGKD